MGGSLDAFALPDPLDDVLGRAFHAAKRAEKVAQTRMLLDQAAPTLSRQFGGVGCRKSSLVPGVQFSAPVQQKLDDGCRAAGGRTVQRRVAGARRGVDVRTQREREGRGGERPLVG